MFDFVRKHTRILQLLLLILILPSFVIFGFENYFRDSGDNDVVGHVGRQKVSKAELDNVVRNAAERARAQQPDIDPALFDTPEFRQQALDSLLRDYTINAAARDLRLTTTDQRLQRIFTNSPDFAAFRNADGTVNVKLLEAQGITSAQFAERLRQQISVTQVMAGVESTVPPANKATRIAVEALFQVRDVQWTALKAKDYAAQVQPTPEQLRKFFEDPAVAESFMQPENADIQFVVLDLESLKKRVSVSEDDLRKYYEQNIQRFTQPEERRASHILVKADKAMPEGDRKAARAKADKLLAQAQANPASFGELARRNSDDPGSAANGGDLDFFPRGAMVKAFEEAAFGLKKGELSAVVESDFGFHIILLTDTRGGQAKPFADVRADLDAEVRKQLAQKQYAEAAERFTNMVYEQSDALQPVADELKLALRTANGVTRQPVPGTDPLLANAKLLAALFDTGNIQKQRNTEAVEVAPSTLVSARVVKHHPRAKPAFEAVEGTVRERFVARESLRLASEDAQRKKAQWEKAPDSATLPASVQMSRRTSFSQPPAVLDAALRIPESKLPAFATVDLGTEGVAILRVNKIVPLQVVPEEEKATRAQFASYWGRAEADAYLRSLKLTFKAEATVKPADAASVPKK